MAMMRNPVVRTRLLLVAVFWASRSVSPAQEVVGLETEPRPSVGAALSDLPGPSGYALEFDGDDWAMAEDNPLLDLTQTNQFTLEAWVLRRPEGEYWQVVLSKDNTRE